MSIMHPLAVAEEHELSPVPQPIRIERRLKIDLVEYALMIENIMAEVLVAPLPVGLYSREHLEPVLRADRTYHQKVNVEGVEQERLIRADNLDQIHASPIYDENHRVVVPTYITRNAKHNLSLQSFHPYWGMKIALMLINWRLSYRAPWVKNLRDPMDELLDHMPGIRQAIAQCRQKILELPEQVWPVDPEIEALHQAAEDARGQQEAHAQNFYTIVEDSMIDLLRLMDSYVGKDIWHHYFVKVRGTVIVVEKGEDFRLLQWEQEHGHEYAPRSR